MRHAASDVAEAKLLPFEEYVQTVGTLPPPATHIQRPANNGDQINDLLNDDGAGIANAGSQQVSPADVAAVKQVLVDPSQQPALIYLYREQCFACFETVQRLSFMMQRLKDMTSERVAFLALNMDKFSKFDAREIAALLQITKLPEIRYLRNGSQLKLPVEGDLEAARDVAWSDKLLDFLVENLADRALSRDEL